jgi:hypothetical protein
MTGIIHPWRMLRKLTHITLLWHDGGDAGLTDHEAGTISLRRGMTQDERRCTILHECLHVERGPILDTLEDREELRIDRMVARLLMPDIKVVGEALAWSRDLDEAAWELSVDQGTLVTRLHALHPTERAYLERRLSEPGETVAGC